MEKRQLSVKYASLERLTEQFYELVRNLALKRTTTFSGIGLVLYDSEFLHQIPCSPLKPHIVRPRGIVLGRHETVDALLRIGDISNPLHDGFHFFNEKGLLTHIAQFLAPGIVDDVPLDEHHGTRYRVGQYGSCLSGVIVTGVVLHGGTYFCFYQGRPIEETDIATLDLTRHSSISGLSSQVKGKRVP